MRYFLYLDLYLLATSKPVPSRNSFRESITSPVEFNCWSIGSSFYWNPIRKVDELESIMPFDEDSIEFSTNVNVW